MGDDTSQHVFLFVCFSASGALEVNASHCIKKLVQLCPKSASDLCPYALLSNTFQTRNSGFDTFLVTCCIP